MSKPPAIGIDLGTTNSCVAVFQNGRVDIIPNTEGSKTTPSVVAFRNEDIVVGEPAVLESVMNVKNTIYGKCALEFSCLDKQYLKSWFPLR